MQMEPKKKTCFQLIMIDAVPFMVSQLLLSCTCKLGKACDNPIIGQTGLWILLLMKQK